MSTYFDEKALPKGIRDAVEFAIDKNMPVLLTGETGTGKTSYIRYLAAKHGKPYYRLNLNGQSNVEEIIGKWLIDPARGTYWIDGQLTHVVRNGGFLVIDEINAATPEILLALHELLDDDHRLTLHEKDREIVLPHPEFRLFGTMNPNYSGTRELNKALVSRFRITVDMPYLSESRQLQIVQHITKSRSLKNLVAASYQLQKAFRKRTIETPVTIREMVTASMLVKYGMGMTDAIKYAILDRMNTDDRAAAEKIISLYIGEKEAKPTPEHGAA